VPDDIKTVAKVVLIDESDRVLFLKRSNYMEKFAGEWDLPGGHLKSNESMLDGLEREVREETNLGVQDPKLIEVQANLHFFYAKYDSEPIKISHEHTSFRFFDKGDLDPNEKFQKIALKALEMKNDQN
jgi:8-oxo-dGTP pyrophosphatase MutT (NUDIX family)